MTGVHNNDTALCGNAIGKLENGVCNKPAGHRGRCALKNGALAAHETTREEHDRLQERTDELKQDHANLSRDLVPFDKADHDQHTSNLRDHQDDLAAHKLRQKDPKSG